MATVKTCHNTALLLVLCFMAILAQRQLIMVEYNLNLRDYCESCASKSIKMFIKTHSYDNNTNNIDVISKGYPSLGWKTSRIVDLFLF